MAENQDYPARFRENAALVIRMFREQMNVPLDYDEKSIIWVEGYLERQRQKMDDKGREWFTWIVGAYLGECIVRQFGAHWANHPEYGWGIAFDDGNFMFPFAKVEKQIFEGNAGGQSISSFYKSIPALFKLRNSDNDQK